MSNSPTTLIRPWKGFANLRVYPAELRRDLEELESFIKDIRQAVGKMVGEVSITNTTITNVTSDTTIFADYGLDGGGQLTSDVHLSVDAELEATGTEAWTGSHAWEPSLNSEPITVSKTASLLSADLVRILDTDTTPLFVVDNVGLTGINCEPDAMLTVQGAGALSPPVANPAAWYRADSLALSNTADVDTWADSSGNGNHLTAGGSDSLNNNLPLVKPKYYSTGQTKATTNLPAVSFEGSLTPDQFGYFSIDTGTMAFTAAAGWTFAFIIRDYDAAALSASRFFGVNVPGGGIQGDNTQMLKGVNATRWNTQEGGPIAGDAFYSTVFGHTDANDTEAIVIRKGAGAGANLRCWLDGTLQTATADTHSSNYNISYIGRHIASASSAVGVYGKSVAEIIIYNTALSDADVAIVNTYLLNRIAGTASSSSYDLTRWKNTLGTLVASIDGNGVLNITTPTTQEHIGYDTSNYYTTSVSSTGIVTFDAVGAGQSFVFADPVSITGDITGSAAIRLPYTTSSTIGPIFRNNIRWAHDFTNPTGFVDGSLNTLVNIRNVFIGLNAGNFTLSGTSTQGKANSGFGHFVLNSLTTGSQNNAQGWNALGALTIGAANNAQGAGALELLLSGDGNTAQGAAALGSVTTGGANTAVGDSAGISLVTASNSVFLGSGTDASGDFSNVIAIGTNTIATAANSIELGNTSHTITNIYGTTTVTQGPVTDNDGAFVFVGGGTSFGGGTDGDFGVIAGHANAGSADGGGVYISSGSGVGGGGDGLVVLSSGNIGGLPSVTLSQTNITFNADGAYLFVNPTITTFTGELKFNLLDANRQYTFPNATGTLALTSGIPLAGNPLTPSVKLIADNGVLGTFMRSDAVLALDQSIIPTWTGIHTFTPRDIHNGGITAYSTTAQQLSLGFNSGAGMIWDTSSTGATTLTMAANTTTVHRLSLQPSGSAMSNTSNAGTFRVLDFSGNQRFWVGRINSGPNALLHGLRFGFNDTNYLQVSNGVAADTDFTISTVNTAGTNAKTIIFSPAVRVDGTFAATSTSTFTGLATFNNGITVNGATATLNTGYALAASTISTGVSGSTFANTSSYRIAPASTFPGIAIPSAWTPTTVYAVPSGVSNGGTRQYVLTVGGTSGATGPVGTTVGGTEVDGTCTWKYLGVVHSGVATYNQFHYSPTDASDHDGINGNDTEFISIRGWNVTDGTGNRQDTSEYALFEQMTWGFTGSGERVGEWFFTHVPSVSGTAWKPWGMNITGIATPTPTADVTFRVSPSQIGFQFNSAGMSVSGSSGGNGDLEIHGTGILYLTGSNCLISFEGAVVNAFHTNLGVAEPTAVNTINLPDYSGTVIVNPGGLTAFTQTYATASHTHANPTGVVLTDSTGGTANTTCVAIAGTGDDANVNNNFADIIAQVNALVADVANVKQVLNAVIDDGQLDGAFS